MKKLSLPCFRYLVAGFLMLSYSAVIQAQIPEYGEVSITELELESYPPAPSANALILFQKGEFYFDENLDLVFYKHIRFKAFNKKGLDEISEKLILNRDVGQELLELKVSHTSVRSPGSRNSRNLVPLDSALFVKNDRDEGTQTLEVTFDEFVENAVYEIRFIAMLGHPGNIKTWEIQRSLPVNISELEFWKHNFFRYNIYSKGDMSDVYSERTGYADSYGTGVTLKWSATKVPPLEETPLLSSIENYRTSLDFQLYSIEVPGEMVEILGNSWDDVQLELASEFYFWGQLRSQNLFESTLQALYPVSASRDTRIRAIFDHVVNNYSWNGEYDHLAGNSLGSVINNTNGNSAEINLLLIKMMREAGIDAQPMLLSTRSNGFVNRDKAVVDQFNTVVCYIESGDSTYYLDATQGLRPLDLPPVENLNESGYIAAFDSSGWVDLTAPVNSEDFSFTGNISADGYISGTMEGRLSGYALIDKWPIDGYDSENILLERLNTDDRSSVSYQNFNSELSGQSVLTLRTEVDSLRARGNRATADQLTFYPLLTHWDIDNPLKEGPRELPIEFPNPWSRSFTASFTIPEGYVIRSLPEPVSVTLPGNDARLRISASKTGERIISFVYDMEINSTKFPAEAKRYLIQLYELENDGKNRQVVLTKK